MNWTETTMHKIVPAAVAIVSLWLHVISASRCVNIFVLIFYCYH